VAGNLAPVADPHPLLYLNERANLYIIANLAPVKVHESE
jgi:hypothetical protein